MFCKNCGNEVDSKAIICPKCGVSIREVKVKKPVFKKWWFWVIVVFAFFAVVGASTTDSNESVGGGNGTSSSQNSAPNNIASVPSEFAAECPIDVSANVSDNIIGVPEVTCHITNKTEKTIAAIQFYFLPKDVYGDDVDTLFTYNKLSTDEAIDPLGSCERGWQLLDQDVKSGNLYIYSVYFQDGTEWGDKDASVSTIKKYGIKIEVGS